MIRSFLHLTRVDLGFDPTDVLTFELRVDSEYSTREGIIAFHNDLLDRLSGLPGVEAVGAAACVPFKGQCAARSGGSLERDAPRDEGRNVQMRNMVVSASYFETMRMELLAGRLLEPGPADSLSIVISAAAAEDRWPGEDPLGRVVWFGNPTREPPPPQWHTVVGVVADVPVSAVTGDRRVNYRIAYYPEGAPRCCVQTMTVAMRTSTPPLDLIEAVRSTVRSMDASLPMGNIRTMEDYLASARAPMVFTMVVLIVGGMVALLLGVIGIYGVISYVVGRRGTEIGIRMAVGATAADVKAMVLRQGGSVIVVGVLLGLLGAFALTRMMESVIFGVSPTDPATYVAASVGLLVIALLATYLPARRAARVDPVEALRAD